jgi:endonuclease/exonuclease/phosphatase family metal-dependent hydrolase
MKVVTLNLRHDADRWSERFPLVIKNLVEISPDLIAFQEVCDSIHQADLVAERLNSQLSDTPHYNVFYEKKWRNQDNEGIAILTRLKVAKYESIQLPIGGRVAQKIKITQDSNEYIFINTHLHHKPKDNEMIRMRQIKAILEWVSDELFQCIIIGDFNAKPKSKTILTLKKIYKSAYETINENEPEFTFPTPLISDIGEWFEPRTVDYIFYNPAVYTLTDSKLVMITPDLTDSTLFSSDHFGLFAEITR